MAITRSCAIDKLKERPISISLDETEDYQLPAHCHAENFEELILIRDALRTLSEEERLLVRLRLHIGLSHKEISSLLEIGTATVRKKYSRAIEKLRTYYKEGE